MTTMATSNTALPNPPCLTVENRDGVFRIGINNPAHRNALTHAMWQDLAAQIAHANADPSARVIALHGVGGVAFCSGADISEFKTLRTTPEQVRNYDHGVHLAHEAILGSAKPTVALIHGICMGGGMEIAAACDLRYANDNARIRMPAAVLGLGYALDGITRMVDIMGAATTLDLFLTARHFDGREAARIGFIHEAFPEGEFELATRERVLAVASNAPLTIKAIRMSVRHVLGRGTPPSGKEVAAVVAACFQSEDYAEGRQAFAQKRKPQFKGR